MPAKSTATPSGSWNCALVPVPSVNPGPRGFPARVETAAVARSMRRKQLLSPSACQRTQGAVAGLRRVAARASEQGPHDDSIGARANDGNAIGSVEFGCRADAISVGARVGRPRKRRHGGRGDVNSANQVIPRVGLTIRGQQRRVNECHGCDQKLPSTTRTLDT